MHITLFNEKRDHKVGLAAFATVGYAMRELSQLFSVLLHEPKMKRRMRRTCVNHQ